MLVTFSMLGKLAITSSYGTVYIFSAELFPTVVRNVGMGTASLNARIGGILCPYINMLRWKLLRWPCAKICGAYMRILAHIHIIQSIFRIRMAIPNTPSLTELFFFSSDTWTPLPLIIYGVLAFTA